MFFFRIKLDGIDKEVTDFITNKGTSELSGKNIEDKLKIRLQIIPELKFGKYQRQKRSFSER